MGIGLESDGIIRAVFHPSADVTLADAYEDFTVLRSLCGGRRRRLLCDLRGLVGMSEQSREFWTGSPTSDLFVAVALLVAPGESERIAAFFASVERRDTTTRVFTSDSAAMEWLRGCDLDA